MYNSLDLKGKWPKICPEMTELIKIGYHFTTFSSSCFLLTLVLVWSKSYLKRRVLPICVLTWRLLGKTN